MTSFNKVLIVLDVYNDYRDDPTHQPIEIRKAIQFIGERKEASLILIGCGFEEFLHDSYSNFGPDALDQRKQFIAEMERRLQVFAEVLTGTGYQVECKVHWTYPRYQQISQEAEQLNVDLVVQHAHDKQAFEHHNLSHDSWQLIKICPKPVLLVKDEEWSQRSVVLAAVDPVHSHHKPLGLDYKIMGTALRSGAAIGGEVHVLHAFSGSARPFAQADSLRDIHTQAMNELLADYEIAAERVHLIDDTPVNAILACEKKLQAGIIVLGVLSRSRLQEVIIGNTANRVLNYVKSDLLIVKPN
jgi:universal stress protein E